MDPREALVPLANEWSHQAWDLGFAALSASLFLLLSQVSQLCWLWSRKRAHPASCSLASC